MPLYCNYCGGKNSDASKFCSSCGEEIISGGTVSSSLAPDTIVGTRYTIISLIKAGGMGAVYRALDGRLDRLCAVKELFSDYEDPQDQEYAIKRFNSEAKILSNLQHDHLPVVYDYFIENGRYYLVMSFIEGEDLDTILERDGLPYLLEDKVVEWAKQILDVLDYLHNQEPAIIYRDIKPANIMIRKDGRAMLVDFGIARVVNPEQRVSKTSIGTDGYAPKEQYKGQVEPRSDIYALGATMHHLLTGEIPVPLDFEPVSFFNQNITPSLEQIVMKALEREVYNRFENAREMFEALETYKVIKQQNITDDVFDLQIDEEESVSDEFYDLVIDDESPSGPLAPVEEGEDEELSVPGLLEWADDKDTLTVIREEENRQSLKPKEKYDNKALDEFSKDFEKFAKTASKANNLSADDKPGKEYEEDTEETEEIEVMEEGVGDGEEEVIEENPEYMEEEFNDEEFDEISIEEASEDSYKEKEDSLEEEFGEEEFDELSIEEEKEEEIGSDDLSIEEEEEEINTIEEKEAETDTEEEEEINTIEEKEAETDMEEEEEINTIEEKEAEIDTEEEEEINTIEEKEAEIDTEEEEEINTIEAETDTEEKEAEIDTEEEEIGEEEKDEEGQKVTEEEKEELKEEDKEIFEEKVTEEEVKEQVSEEEVTEKERNSEEEVIFQERERQQEEEVRQLEEELQKKVHEELQKIQEEELEEDASDNIMQEKEIIPTPKRKKKIKAEEIIHKPKEQIVRPPKSFTSLLKPFGANLPNSIVHPKDEAEMIYIPSGLFVMGSDEQEDDNPKTHVYLYAYYIDKYPVTNFRYNMFLRDTNYTEPESWNYSPQTADHPVICIDWEDAKAYAEWCGKRLPTEAEWEKAARGTDERIYPWGNEWDKYKCNNWNMDDPDIVEKMMDIENDRGTTPIGCFPSGASPFSVMDTAGNVAEWCSDLYKSTLVSGKLKKIDKEKEKEKDLRVCRGGSWRDVMISSFHVSHRKKAIYYETFDDVGFRCCQTPRHL